MFRILRAFAWMRWRVFMNSLERTGARDRLERFSIAAEQIGPIIALVLMIPSMVILSGLSAAGGYMLARGVGRPMLLEAVRVLLGLATVLSVVGPLLISAADRTNPVRLLLLPISRPTLYVSQTTATLADIWILLTLPIVVFLPIGLAVGGAIVAAAAAVAGGVLLVAVLTGLTGATTTLLHLLLRDRRRGEILALFFIVVLPTIGMLPGLLGASRNDGEHGARPRHQPSPAWVQTTARTALAIAPSELYLKATGFQVADRRRPAATPLAGLVGASALLHGLGLFLFGKVLESPGSMSARRTHVAHGIWARKLPLLTSGASAVALAQVRLALRTSRGRSTLISPLFVFLIFAIGMRRGALEFGFSAVHGGLALATFGAFFSLIATLPILMNQFTVDGAGLTMVLLSPLSDREVLRGKAVGNGLIVFLPIALCLMLSVTLFPSGSPALWISIPIALLGTYAIVAPLAAMVSAVFPRAVDMNSIGRSGNPHGLAGLVGMFTFVAGTLPSALLVVLASTVLRRPALTPLFLSIWTTVAILASRLLFVPAERVFRRRRENLALIV